MCVCGHVELRLLAGGRRVVSLYQSVYMGGWLSLSLSGYTRGSASIVILYSEVSCDLLDKWWTL